MALAATGVGIMTAVGATPTPDTIWGTGTPTSAVVDSDTAAVELGTRFSPVVGGEATGVRFFKTTENSGQHVGSLWTDTGQLLGRVTFSSETTSGWQTATFSTPVALTAGRSYVVSYHTNVGRYVSTTNFAGSSVSPTLSVPASGVGVYSYSASSSFPTASWNNSQYWVDLTFAAQSTATGSATTATSSTSATGTPTAATSSASTATTTATATASKATTAPATSATPTAGSTTTATASTTTTKTPNYKTTKASLPSPTTTTSTATTSTTTTSTATTAPATTSTTTSSAGMTNCVSQPSRCGYPDATNTGIAAGTSLLRVPQDVTSGPGWVWDSRGWLQASSGAVVKNLVVSGSISAAGSNITITNNRILADGEAWGVGLQHTTNALVSNNEIGILHGLPRLAVGVKDVYGDCSGTQVLRNNIQNTSTGVQTHEGLIADNYIHDMGYQTGDHINGTTSNGDTTPMTIRHNTILNQIGQTDAISLFQDFGLEANRLVTDNLIAGGGYTIYGGGGSKGTSYNIQITNNRFSTLYYANGGSYGPVTAFDYSGSGNVASGNVWDSNLSAVRF